MKQAEKIGLVLSRNAYGKYDVEFVFVDVGVGVRAELVTDNRPLPIALREMRLAIDKLSTRLSRGEYKLTSEEPSTVKVDDKKP